jgi:flagellar basal-body rod protein FlgG
MLRSLNTASTGMMAQQINLDVIANNLANSSTTGFKKSRGNFEDLMYEGSSTPGAQTANNTVIPTGTQVGLGAKTVSVEKVFTQGTFSQTSNNLDMAIEGRGFFKVLRGTQECYTRSGAFTLDKDSYVVDAEGNKLQPEITIPKTTTTITIDSTGTVSCTDSTGKVVSTSNIKLSDFPNPSGLVSSGHNYFIASDASGDVSEGTPGSDQYGTLMQGYLENSNISVVEEMVNMIMSQRAYEANSKIIKTADEMLRMANNVQS